MFEPYVIIIQPIVPENLQSGADIDIHGAAASMALNNSS